MIGSARVPPPPFPLGWCCPSAAVEHASAAPRRFSPRCSPLASAALICFKFFSPSSPPIFWRFSSRPPARRAASAGAQLGAMPPGPPLLRGPLPVLFLLHLLGPPGRGAVYSNHFLVELHDGGQAEAERVAEEHGFGGVRKLPFLESGYFFYHNGLAKARRRRSLQHKLRLEKDSRNAKASYDFSSNDPYPYPRYTDDWFNSHGTRCAGEVSAAANNNICGVGVAYNSKVAGIRMLDQPFMTDIIEASSISHMPQVIDIYSASWGPTDNGKTVDGPRELTLQAMADGVNKGRGGKGSIYVWASGDGGSYDDCNCDGYASSMWTISINSAINDGRTALYDESCSSTLASTFSNGRKRNPEAGVATTDLYGNCTLRHSGTSAAAPEAAGVFALALEANLHLTWRDMQHLTVLTSKRNQLHDEVHRWRRNGVGLEFNHLFGYGVLDAGAMVKMAKDWKTVPERFHCVGGSIQEPEKIPPSGKLFLTLTTDACEGKENFVRYLEHVQAVITVNSTRRGDLNINMTSPMGTKSILLSRRPRDDDSKVGFDKWPFMTTHTWGEDPRGTWALEIGFVGSQPQRGVLKEWTLMLHGTQSAPYIDQIVKDYQSKLAMSKKEELEEELDEAVERSLKSILSKK
ncbi:neuroendocrine convertase 2 isoform X3 [Serinus canaria]|uniref:neuroendocrine convertase 2 isoform X3 n=1 Tax=Serinus canaria TaxID=9135 RepID=UPI0021CCAF93|nr:neuroendocrine convertase 2 isoform X3 [Serinus canaria]